MPKRPHESDPVIKREVDSGDKRGSDDEPLQKSRARIKHTPTKKTPPGASDTESDYEPIRTVWAQVKKEKDVAAEAAMPPIKYLWQDAGLSTERGIAAKEASLAVAQKYGSRLADQIRSGLDGVDLSVATEDIMRMSSYIGATELHNWVSRFGKYSLASCFTRTCLNLYS